MIQKSRKYAVWELSFLCTAGTNLRRSERGSPRFVWYVYLLSFYLPPCKVRAGNIMNLILYCLTSLAKCAWLWFVSMYGSKLLCMKEFTTSCIFTEHDYTAVPFVSSHTAVAAFAWGVKVSFELKLCREMVVVTNCPNCSSLLSSNARPLLFFNGSSHVFKPLVKNWLVLASCVFIFLFLCRL